MLQPDPQTLIESIFITFFDKVFFFSTEMQYLVEIFSNFHYNSAHGCFLGYFLNLQESLICLLVSIFSLISTVIREYTLHNFNPLNLDIYFLDFYKLFKGVCACCNLHRELQEPNYRMLGRRILHLNVKEVLVGQFTIIKWIWLVVNMNKK